MTKHKYMAQGRHTWGGGQTIKEAVDNMAEAGGAGPDGYVVVELIPPCTIETDQIRGPMKEASSEFKMVEDHRKGKSRGHGPNKVAGT